MLSSLVILKTHINWKCIIAHIAFEQIYSTHAKMWLRNRLDTKSVQEMVSSMWCSLPLWFLRLTSSEMPENTYIAFVTNVQMGTWPIQHEHCSALVAVNRSQNLFHPWNQRAAACTRCLWQPRWDPQCPPIPPISPIPSLSPIPSMPHYNQYQYSPRWDPQLSCFNRYHQYLHRWQISPKYHQYHQCHKCRITTNSDDSPDGFLNYLIQPIPPIS